MDANATTPLLPAVFEAMRPYFVEQFGNASSIHLHGQRARAAVDHAREQVAASDRDSIQRILQQTKTDLPDYWSCKVLTRSLTSAPTGDMPTRV